MKFSFVVIWGKRKLYECHTILLGAESGIVTNNKFKFKHLKIKETTNELKRRKGKETLWISKFF